MNVDGRDQRSVDPWDHARALNRWTLTQLDVRKLVNQLRASQHSPQARIALAGNVVLAPLADHLLVHLACDAMMASSYCVPYGQLVRELLDRDSQLSRFDPTFLYIHVELDSLLADLKDRRAFQTAEHRRAALVEILDPIESTLEIALKSTNAIVLLSNFVTPRSYTLGLADLRSEYGEHEFFCELNLSLARSAGKYSRVQIVDLAALTALHGYDQARDRRLYYMSKIPWRESFYAPLADRLARHVKLSLGQMRKCLVTDLDNTLWRGVIAEDGPLGVRVGIGDPLGEAHLDLQRNILGLKQRGVLLAVCSKNNPEDVAELFRSRPEMPLRASDFACMEIGWAPKHEGLRRIAETLNIGTDSLVFLDDSAAEIALIEQMMPEVECVLLPTSSSEIGTCLDTVHGLDRLSITAEDMAKDRQYADAAARTLSRADYADLQDYLRSLQTSIDIQPVTDALLPRAHQLFHKTNQFNLTGRRYTLAELERAARDSSMHLFMVHAQDRFGDLGWIGALLLRTDEASNCHIDNFVLSCRALGRGIDIPVLNYVREIAFEHRGHSCLTAEYRVTSKNAQVRMLFETHGFAATRSEPDGSKHYVLPKELSRHRDCDWISITGDHAHSVASI